MTTEEKLTYAIQALRDVVDPVGKFRREMPEGGRLDGPACVLLIGLPSTFIDIANQALKTLDKIGGSQ